MAVAGQGEPQDILARAAAMDPLRLGGEFGGPYVKERLGPFLDEVPGAGSERQTAEFLSGRLARYNVFHPFKTLAIAFASVVARPQEPLKAILIAVNHRGDAPPRFQDIDCYGCVAGALAGAMAGSEAFPPELLERVVQSNKDVYGFDSDAVIERLLAALG